MQACGGHKVRKLSAGSDDVEPNHVGVGPFQLQHSSRVSPLSLLVNFQASYDQLRSAVKELLNRCYRSHEHHHDEHTEKQEVAYGIIPA